MDIRVLPGSVHDKKAEWIWVSWTNWRRANVRLKNWHIPRKLRCCPWRAG
jgi:hypothetical protein